LAMSMARTLTLGVDLAVRFTGMTACETPAQRSERVAHEQAVWGTIQCLEQPGPANATCVTEAAVLGIHCQQEFPSKLDPKWGRACAPAERTTLGYYSPVAPPTYSSFP